MKKSTIVFLVVLGVVMVLIAVFVIYARLTVGPAIRGMV